MKRSLLTLLTVAVFAVLALFERTSTVLRDIASTAYRVSVDAILTRASAFERRDPVVLDVTTLPAVAIVRARSFVARLVKREQPTIEASWRMCPSI